MSQDYSNCLRICNNLLDDKDALFRLAMLYKGGKGVERDLLKASAYMVLAIDCGHRGAIREFELMVKTDKTIDERKALLGIISDICTLDEEVIPIITSSMKDGIPDSFKIAKRIFDKDNESFLSKSMVLKIQESFRSV